MERILAALARDDGQATGRLHRELFGDGGLDRRSFEHLLGALASAGLVEVRDASFQKDGERIDFKRVSLTDEGRDKSGGALGHVPVQQEEARPKKRKKDARKGPARGDAKRGTASADAKKGTASADAKKDAARRAFFAKRARARKKG